MMIILRSGAEIQNQMLSMDRALGNKFRAAYEVLSSIAGNRDH